MCGVRACSSGPASQRVSMNMDRMQRTVGTCALVLLAAVQASAYCPTPLTLQRPLTLATRSSFNAPCQFLPSGPANSAVHVQRQVHPSPTFEDFTLAPQLFA